MIGCFIFSSMTSNSLMTERTFNSPDGRESQFQLVGCGRRAENALANAPISARRAGRVCRASPLDDKRLSMAAIEHHEEPHSMTPLESVPVIANLESVASRAKKELPAVAN